MAPARSAAAAQPRNMYVYLDVNGLCVCLSMYLSCVCVYRAENNTTVQSTSQGKINMQELRSLYFYCMGTYRITLLQLHPLTTLSACVETPVGLLQPHSCLQSEILKATTAL